MLTSGRIRRVLGGRVGLWRRRGRPRTGRGHSAREGARIACRTSYCGSVAPNRSVEPLARTHWLGPTDPPTATPLAPHAAACAAAAAAAGDGRRRRWTPPERDAAGEGRRRRGTLAQRDADGAGTPPATVSVQARGYSNADSTSCHHASASTATTRSRSCLARTVVRSSSACRMARGDGRSCTALELKS